MQTEGTITGFFTKCVFEILDNRSFPGTVFPLHIVGRHKACFVSGISNPPPGLGVVKEPEALVFLDVQLLVLLGHVVELGDDNHLFRHLALGALVEGEERTKNGRQSGQSECSTLQKFPTN